MREGIIKINPSRFFPVISYKTGKVIWGGTKREAPHTESMEICRDQQSWAFDHINETVMFEFDKKDGYVRILNNGKNKRKL